MNPREKEKSEPPKGQKNEPKRKGKNEPKRKGKIRKMKVILLENIKKLGVIGETVEVKDGFARNFLLPKSKCLRASAQKNINSLSSPNSYFTYP